MKKTPKDVYFEVIEQIWEDYFRDVESLERARENAELEAERAFNEAAAPFKAIRIEKLRQAEKVYAKAKTKEEKDDRKS